MEPPSDPLALRAPVDAPTNAFLAFDAMPSAVAVIDADGTVTATNRAWRLFASLNGGSLESTVREPGTSTPNRPGQRLLRRPGVI